MSVDVEELKKTIAQAEGAAIEMVRQGKLDYAMKLVFGTLRECLAPLVESVRELRDSTADLERSLREERALREGLEKEVGRLSGDVGRLMGRLSEYHMGERLASFCERYGLDYEPLPREYRVDAVITGRRVVALIEIAETGEEKDVEQLLDGAVIYERRKGVKPHALILFTRAEELSERIVRLCEEHGIVLETSPKRIASRLAKLDEEMASGPE